MAKQETLKELIERPLVRDAFSPVTRVMLDCGDECITDTSNPKQYQVDTILEKYQRTGVVDHVNKHGASYGELDGSTFQDMMFQVTEAQAMFMELPSSARERFNHDPAEFLDFVDTAEEHRDEVWYREALEHGLLSDEGIDKLNALASTGEEEATPPVDTPADAV